MIKKKKKYKEDTKSIKIGKETNELSSITSPSTDKAEDFIKSLNYFLIQKLYVLIKGDYKDGFSALIFLKHYKR